MRVWAFRFITRPDTLAGVAIIALAMIAYLLSRDLAMGKPARIGPGFFPFTLIGLLGFLGVALLAKSGLGEHESVERWHGRPIFFVSLSVVVFGILVEPTGLFPAAVAAVAVGSLATSMSRPFEVLILAPVVALLVSLIFVLGLNLPIQILKF